MKSIPVEDLNAHLAEALDQSGKTDPVLLTENSAPVGVLLRLPGDFKDSEVDVAVFAHTPGGPMLVLIQSKADLGQPAMPHTRPVFGRGRGTLKVLAEDEEHLRDFTAHAR